MTSLDGQQRRAGSFQQLPLPDVPGHHQRVPCQLQGHPRGLQGTAKVLLHAGRSATIDDARGVVQLLWVREPRVSRHQGSAHRRGVRHVGPHLRQGRAPVRWCEGS